MALIPAASSRDDGKIKHYNEMYTQRNVIAYRCLFFFSLWSVTFDPMAVARSDYPRITTGVPRANRATDYVMKRQIVEQTDHHCDTVLPDTIWT